MRFKRVEAKKGERAKMDDDGEKDVGREGARKEVYKGTPCGVTLRLPLLVKEPPWPKSAEKQFLINFGSPAGHRQNDPSHKQKEAVSSMHTCSHRPVVLRPPSRLK